MNSAIDRLAKALASGVSRRETVTALVAGAAASLPWTVAGKSNKQQRRRRRKQRQLKEFAPYLEYCEDWCAGEFTLGSKQLIECLQLAKTGKGACYQDPAAPGFVCTAEPRCDKGFFCCPNLLGSGRECCIGGCEAINGTTICA